MADPDVLASERAEEETAEPPGGAGPRAWVIPGLGLCGVVLAALLAPTDPLPLPLGLRWLAAFLLFALLPGWLLLRLLLPRWIVRPGVWLDTLLLAVSAGYSLAILLGLALHTLFRPIAPWQIAAGGGLLVAGLALTVAVKTSLTPCAAEGGLGGRGLVLRAWPVLLILLAAAPLRLADLGWSEFQGDEARVVLRAMAALQGADGALAAHRKVPGEILLTYLFAGSLGQIQEGIARLPFALAGVGAVLAFYSLTRKLLGGPAALMAGLLLAVNGYFVAFGRILQYDSLAFFLGMCGLLCCWRFGQERANEDGSDEGAAPVQAADVPPLVWAFLGALLLSGAALVALGAIFLVPPAILLAWPGLWQHRRSWRMLVAWGWPIVPGLLAAWLVFGAADPEAGPTGIMSYLGPRFGNERPYWHGLELLLSADHYLSTPYLAVMLLAGTLAIVLGLVSLARAMSGRGALIRLGIAILLAALTWDRPRVALALGAVLIFLLVLQAPGQRLAMRVALAWAAGPLFVHMFLIRVPGTHWREAFPGLILVLAVLAAPALAHPRTRALVSGLVAVLVIGVGQFAWVSLVQRQPEYQITYPTDRHLLDWSNQDGRGIGGVFGAVHHHGWKALGVLMADGAFPEGYGTNESVAIAAWYLRRPEGCEGSLAYVFRVPRTPQDRNLAGPVPLPAGYQTRGQIRVNGRTTISIQLPPTDPTRLGDIPADAYEDGFDRELASVWRPVGELYRADLGAAAAKRACAPKPAVP